MKDFINDFSTWKKVRHNRKHGRQLLGGVREATQEEIATVPLCKTCHEMAEKEVRDQHYQVAMAERKRIHAAARALPIPGRYRSKVITTLYLEVDQRTALMAVSQTTGTPMAELVRSAIDRFLEVTNG